MIKTCYASFCFLLGWTVGLVVSVGRKRFHISVTSTISLDVNCTVSESFVQLNVCFFACEILTTIAVWGKDHAAKS